MKHLVVVENVARWPFHVPGVEVVPARTYLTDHRYAGLRDATVHNFCRHYGYQRLGYYVSLLAAARGHRPLPSVQTMQMLKLQPVVRTVSGDMEALVASALGPLKSDAFLLSIYFGRNPAKRYDRLCQALFDQFPAPLLRAFFSRHDGEWALDSVRLIATNDIPDNHVDFVLARASEYFARPTRVRRRRRYRYELAILWDEADLDAPSDDRAIKRMARAARRAGMAPEVIDETDYGRVAEFDALFIRRTTRLDHHTFRFAQRAAAEGLVVIDDPQSIIRCTNKVYQAELFTRHEIPAPKTLLVQEGEDAVIEEQLGFPCVLKRPDSSFSRGVVRADNAEELRRHLAAFFEDSELVVAQEYVPSEFDWRVGVLDRQLLYACRYHMAAGHWQIIANSESPRPRYGRVEALPFDAVPPRILKLGVRAASLFGDGLYGVDVKQVGKRLLVTEVNDNPTLEAGYEDRIAGDVLYDAIMEWFRKRLDARGGPNGVA